MVHWTEKLMAVCLAAFMVSAIGMFGVFAYAAVNAVDHSRAICQCVNCTCTDCCCKNGAK